MSIHTATALQIEVASISAPGDFHLVQGIFVRNFRIRQDTLLRNTIAGDAWEKRSNTTKQVCEMEIDFALNSKQASSILQHASLQAETVMMNITLPDTSQLSGPFVIPRYELFAEDNDVLNAAFEAISSDSLSHQVS